MRSIAGGVFRAATVLLCAVLALLAWSWLAVLELLELTAEAAAQRAARRGRCASSDTVELANSSVLAAFGPTLER